MLTSKELYDKVEKIRIQKGMPVAQLNRLAGISHATLNSWKIRGTMPKLDVLEGISLALEIPLAALLYDVEVDKLTGEEIELLFYWKKLTTNKGNPLCLPLRLCQKLNIFLLI